MCVFYSMYVFTIYFIVHVYTMHLIVYVYTCIYKTNEIKYIPYFMLDLCQGVHATDSLWLKVCVRMEDYYES